MTLPDPANSRVVLIGASRFTDPELPDLPAVRNNLDGLAVCLAQTGRCTVVADPESPVDLVDPIHDAATEAEDTLLIYYAGHGLVHPRTLSLLLAVVGSAPGRTHTAVPYDLVRENVIDSPARRKVVILDCCYSGRAIGGMADPTTALVNEATVEGTYLLASAPPNKQALSPPGEEFTAFTGALLTLFRDGVPDGPELLRLDLIYRQVRDSLRRAARPEPQLRAANTVSELALVRNPWHRPELSLAPIVDVPVVPLPTGNPVRHETVRPDLIGSRYQLHEPIEGTLRVALATDTATQRLVVVKQLGADQVVNDRVVGLDHPAIVQVLDVLDSRVVLEYVDGRTLAETLLSDGPMALAPATRIMVDVCDALGYAYENGVIHGALNSRNVMLAKDGAVKILNVGTGKFFDYQADVAAAGRLLVELLTGQTLGFGTFPLLPAGISPELGRIVWKAIRPDYGKEYRGASHLGYDLKRSLRQ